VDAPLHAFWIWSRVHFHTITPRPHHHCALRLVIERNVFAA
jgi:hypothetical protein